MCGFFSRDNASRLAIEIDAVPCLDAAFEIANIANVEFERAPNINDGDFRQYGDDVEMDTEFERLPPGQIETRKALRKSGLQDCQRVDCGAFPRWRLRQRLR